MNEYNDNCYNKYTCIVVIIQYDELIIIISFLIIFRNDY